MEEIELQLEERPDDLSVWGSYLSWCHRNNLLQKRYEKYIQLRGFNCCFDDPSWELAEGFDLDLLRGVYAPNLKHISIDSENIQNIEALSYILIPNMLFLQISIAQHLHIPELPPTLQNLELFGVSCTLGDTIQFPELTLIKLTYSKILNVPYLYRADKLTEIYLYDSGIFSISEFKQIMRVYYRGIDSLNLLNSSKTLQILEHEDPSKIKELISKGWYPNLKYPIKGLNIQ